MGELKLLLKIRLNEALGLSNIHYEKNGREKVKKIVHVILYTGLAVVILAAISEISLLMAKMGYAEILPILGYVLSSIITLIVTIVSINGMLSGSRDAEYVMSLPVSAFVQVLVMFIMLYIKNFLCTVMIAGPMGIVYGSFVSVKPDFWGTWIIGLFLTCLPASGMAALVGMILAVVLSSSKNSNLYHSLFSLGIIAGVFMVVIRTILRIGEGLGAGMRNSSNEICQMVLDQIISNYKLGRFYQRGIIEQNPIWIFLFVLMSVIWYLFFVFFLSMNYQELILALRSPVVYNAYTFKGLQEKSLNRALYERELRQWLQSKSYMAISLVGALGGLLVSLTLWIKGVDPLAQMFSITEYLPQIQRCIPLFLCFIAGCCCTGYRSFLAEGDRSWIMQTTPVDEKALCRSKRRLNLMITFPAVLLCAVFLCSAFKTVWYETVIYCGIPLIYGWISAWWSVRIDKRYTGFFGGTLRQTGHHGMSFLVGYLPGVLIPLVLMAAVL